MHDAEPSNRSWLTSSRLTLIVVLAAAVLGALALSRQHPVVPPPPPAPPAWGVVGHDPARTSHSLSYPAPTPLTLVWGPRPVPTLGRYPVIDGNGNTYLPRADGALLALGANGDTRWCAAVVPVEDAACSGPGLTGGEKPAPPIAPNALVNNDGRLYVVDAHGALTALDPASPDPLWHGPMTATVVTGSGLAPSPDGRTLYGVVSGGAHTFSVVALTRHGRPAGAWHEMSLTSRGLTPVSVAPDGTLLVAARAPDVGGAAALDALDPHGRLRWRVVLDPGRPSFAAIAGADTPRAPWLAWVIVQGRQRSHVYAVDERGRLLWRWNVGHPIAVGDGGVAIARRTADPSMALVYVGSPVGVYGLDLRHKHSWLFFSTARMGATGPPTTDNRGNVYMATNRGHVYAVAPTGWVRWRYDTGRNALGPVVLDPSGNAVIVTRDIAGNTFVEALGGHGTPLQTATALACAVPDCPTATPVESPTAAPTHVASPTSGLVTP